MWDKHHNTIKEKYKDIGFKYENKLFQQFGKKLELPIDFWSELGASGLFLNGIKEESKSLSYLAAALEGLAYATFDPGVQNSLGSHIGLCLHTVNKYTHKK